MKVSIACNSILLTKTLEHYLKDMITTSQNADVIISDDANLNLEKPYFLISNNQDTNLKKPFTKKELLNAIHNFYKNSSILPTWDSIKIGDENYKLKLELESIGKKYAQEMFWSILEHQKRVSKD